MEWNYTERHGGTEFQWQMGLGFNLCVAPPWDRGVSISEDKGAGKGMEHGGMEE